MYEFESRVRYSEVDSNCNLKWSSLVNYLQDCSTFQSEDLGVGVRYLLEKNQAWVLNYWQIDLLKMPKLADYITLGTIPYEVKGGFGLRNFYIKDTKSGEMLVKANSVWTLIDLEKVRPVKADANMIEAYAIGDKLDMEYTDRKIVFEGEPREGTPVTVVSSMLDSNKHVNNEQYLELALAYLPEGSVPKRVRIEYKKSAYLDDVLVPKIYNCKDGIGVALCKQGESDPAVKCLFVNVSTGTVLVDKLCQQHVNGDGSR